MLSPEEKIEIQEILEDFRQEIRNEFGKAVLESNTLPADKDDKVFLIKGEDLYISNNGEWKLIANLT